LTDSLFLLAIICNTAALGMMLGADISVVRLFFQALLPATMGNMCGGGLAFAAVYWYCLDSKGNLLAKNLPDVGIKSATDTPNDSPAGSDENA
jgi:hypothetical protein